MEDRPVDRRRFLVGLAGLAGMLAACTGDDGDATQSPGSATTSGQPTTPTAPTPTAPTSPTAIDRDAALVDAVRRDEDRLFAAYRAALRKHRQLRRDLAVLQGHHEAHLEVLGARPAGSDAPAATGSARQAVADLARRERAAVAGRRRDSGAATSGELARVLAAMAASSAQHVVVLDALSKNSRWDPA